MSDLQAQLSKLTPEQRELVLRKLREKRQQQNKSTELLMQQIARDGDMFPASFAQKRIWFFEQFDPGLAVYNIPMVSCFAGVLDRDVLEKSLNDIIRRHEVLRTTFHKAEDGDVMQKVAPSLYLPLNVTNVDTSLSTEEKVAEGNRFAHQFVNQPFDLENGPLIKFHLLRFDQNEHWLLLNLHHIIADGWSLPVLLGELGRIYEALLTEQEISLPELPVQYIDFTAWQNEWITSGKTSELTDFWREELKGVPNALDFPVDYARPVKQTFVGKSYRHIIPAELSDKVKKFSQHEQATLYMTLLAVLDVLLYRYTGQESFSVGSPVAGRSQGETEALIGCFINTLVLKASLSDTLTFRELLTQIRETTLRASNHQDVPFEGLIEVLQPPRSLNITPFFQVMFVLEAGHLEPISLPSLTVTHDMYPTDTAKFDLSLYISELNGELVASFEYNTDLFGDETIVRLAEHFTNLLTAVIQSPDTPVAKLPLLTPDEESLLIDGWNDTAVSYPTEQCIHQLFEQQVEARPERTAVIFEDIKLTYQQLNEQANQLAHHLQSLGVKPDQFVGLCVERSLDMIVGLLGILKAGAAYLPMDPNYPQERLAYMMADTETAVLLTQSQFVAQLPTDNVQIVQLDSDWVQIGKNNKENLQSDVQANNLAYIIHTSGSTGKPKGVQIEHRNVVNFLETMRQNPGLTAEDTLLAITTLSFDIAGLELYLPLTTGAQLIIASNDLAMDGLGLQQMLSGHGVTVMQATPATWQMMIDSGWQGDGNLKALSGGEALPRQLADALLDRVGELWNMYGPTETTIWSSLWQVKERGTPILIGKPIANTQMYILDKNLQSTPQGVPGELYIGGAGVARGYLNRVDLTAERFLPNPFTNNMADRIYKTGDLARYLPNGDIECLGRLDFQVKVRGFRIELGEIEAVLEQHEAVRQGVVTVRGDILVAYVIMGESVGLDTAVMRAHLSQQLPHYMIPSLFMAVTEYPLTPNGKVDRRALPDPEIGSTEQEAAFVAPRTEMEKLLSGIWAKVLQLEDVSVRDNFFDLGGHSLLAVRLFTQIEQVCKQKLSLSILFEAPTIEQLAIILEDNQEDKSDSIHLDSVGFVPKSVVAVQSKGEKLPFFHTGGAMILRQLSKYLGDDQPLYGVLEQTLEEDQPLHTSVKAIVSDCVEAIQLVQPEGPYMLGGLCFGGVVALEIARTLQAQGHEIALLTLIETYTLAAVQLVPEQRKIGRFTLRMKYHWNKSTENGVSGITSYLARKINKNLLKNRKKVMKKFYAMMGQPIPQQSRNIYETNLAAGEQYVPSIFDGHAVLFQATERPDWYEYDPAMGWDAYFTDGVEVYAISGDHLSIYDEPYVQEFGEKLKACIEEAQLKYKLKVIV